MADVVGEGGAGGNGHRVDWSLDFDDVANTVTIDATHTRMAMDAQGNYLPALASPQRAWVTTQLNSGQPLTVDLLAGVVGTPTGELEDPATTLRNTQPFSSTPGTMLNAGPRTRTNVRLTVTADRARMISFSTQYRPPA